MTAEATINFIENIFFIGNILKCLKEIKLNSQRDIQHLQKILQSVKMRIYKKQKYRTVK